MRRLRCPGARASPSSPRRSRPRAGCFPPGNIGNYGTDYAFRALIAVVGLGANTPVEAIYPSGIADAGGSLYNGSNSYRLTFPPGQQPPAKYFWSLTMYDSSGYLVPNPINRYSIGTSHPPLLRQPDGSIVIAIQRTAPAEAERQLAALAFGWIPAEPAPLRSQQGRPQWCLAPAGRRQGRLSGGSDLQHHRDRAVVDQGDAHAGAEDALLRPRPLAEAVVERLRLLGRRGPHVARPGALAACRRRA